MAFDRSDLRSQLRTAGQLAGANVAPQYFEFDKLAPGQTMAKGSQLWWVRSQSCVVNFARLSAGESLIRTGQPDEHVVLLHDRRVTATVTTGGPADSCESVTVMGRSLIIVPPGSSTIRLDRDAEVVRLFSTQAADMCSWCVNNEFYTQADRNVAAWTPWPDPPGGFRLRAYDLDAVFADSGRFGRLYRCTTLMVNYFYETTEPRDPTAMSPHQHDDFEQLSLQLGGDYVHHIRTPWVPDMRQWRDDEHVLCASPSVTVIPPPSVHTSQAVGGDVHQLIDIFAPPRFDFSEKPGWVINADDYPMPSPS